jgi:hypothetical protein
LIVAIACTQLTDTRANSLHWFEILWQFTNLKAAQIAAEIDANGFRKRL